MSQATSATGLETWISALLTLMILSFLYRDNLLYKVAEHLLVGVSAAYAMVLGFWTTLWPNAVVKLAPQAARLTDPQATPPPADPLVLVPVLLGLLMLCRLWPRLSWLSRWPTAFAIGTTAGYNLVRYLRTDFVGQVAATASAPLVVVADGRWLPGPSLDAVLVLAGTLCGVAYFTYGREHRGAWGGMARVGAWFMMVTFGAAFAYSVMGRVAILIGRLQELLGSWLGLL